MPTRGDNRADAANNGRRRQRQLIRRVVVSRTKVRSGESISVIVRTNPGPNGETPAVVRIAGTTGAQQFVQFSGPPGRRTLLVTAVAPEHVIDTHRIGIEVLPPDPCAPLPILDVAGDAGREATGVWSVRNADDVHRSGTCYEWHYGAKSPVVTRQPAATISYADLLEPNEQFRIFLMRLVVRYPDQSRREVKRSVTVWNQYALAKQRGLVRPRVVYDFRASPEGDHLFGRARISNRDDEHIVFTKQQIQWLLNVPDAPAAPSHPMNVKVNLAPHSAVELEHKIPFDSLPPNAFGFGVILRGETRSGLAAHAAAYFEFHTPVSRGVRVITDPGLLSLLNDLRSEACDGFRRRFTRTDLEELANMRHSRGEPDLTQGLGSLFRALEIRG